MYRYICGVPKMGVPQDRMVYREIPLKMDDLVGVPPFGNPPYMYIYIYIISGMSIDGILEGNNCGRHQWDRFSTSVMNIHGVLVGN